MHTIVADQDKQSVLISNDSTLKCKNERANNSGDVKKNVGDALHQKAIIGCCW